MDPLVERISPRPLHAEVADRLRDLILDGEIGPGDRLNERLLTERFGISRTPLREAIKMLASEGLVQLLPNRGAVVTAITLTNALDMFQVIAVLEALAGELACQRATEADIEEILALHERMCAHYNKRELPEYFRLNQLVHQRIIDCAGNSELADIYRRLSVRFRRTRYMSRVSQERWEGIMQEHEQIIDALKQRDAERLKALLGTHLRSKFDVIQDWLASAEAAEAGGAKARRGSRLDGA